MVSSIEVALRAEGASLSLPETGSEKLCSLSLPLSYHGSKPSSVLKFAAESAGEAIQLELSYPDAPASHKVVAKLTGARLDLPKGGSSSVRLSFIVAREDTRAARDTLNFLLDAAHAQALELDAKLVVVQPPLPFEKSTDVDELDGEVPGGEIDELEVRRRRRPKGSSPSP